MFISSIPREQETGSGAKIQRERDAEAREEGKCEKKGAKCLHRCERKKKRIKQKHISFKETEIA